MDDGISLAELIDSPQRGDINIFPMKVRQSVRRKRKCTHCRKQGHNRRTCPSRRKCGICRVLGHNRRTCPNRFIPPARIKSRKKRVVQIPKPVVVFPRRCDCGNLCTLSCSTGSCKRCCKSPYCPSHYQRAQIRNDTSAPIQQKNESTPPSRNSVSLFTTVFQALTLALFLVMIAGAAELTYNSPILVFEAIWDILIFIWELFISFCGSISAVLEGIWSILVYVYEFIGAI